MVSALKFKDGSSVSKKAKKKVKKPKPQESDGEADSNRADASQSDKRKDTESGEAAGERLSLSPEAETRLGREVAEARSAGVTTLSRPVKTKSQMEWDERQRKTMLERARKDGFKTHEQRVREFNEDLERRTEHNDMPKIGPG